MDAVAIGLWLLWARHSLGPLGSANAIQHVRPPCAMLHCGGGPDASIHPTPPVDPKVPLARPGHALRQSDRAACVVPLGTPWPSYGCPRFPGSQADCRRISNNGGFFSALRHLADSLWGRVSHVE
jgi:hypothetical protein